MSETSQQIDFMNASVAPAMVDQDSDEVLKIARRLVEGQRAQLAQNLAIMNAEGGDSDFSAFWKVLRFLTHLMIERLLSTDTH